MGEVTLSNISVEEFDADAELQETLRSNLAEVASETLDVWVTSDDVTLLGAQPQEGGSRRLLQQILVVGYRIAFVSMAEAESGKDNLLVGVLANVETYAAANGYAGMEAEVLDDIAVVEVISISSDDDAAFGTGAIAGVAAGGGLLLIVLGVVAMRMSKGKESPANEYGGEFTSSSIVKTGGGSIELMPGTDCIVESVKEDLPSATV